MSRDLLTQLRTYAEQLDAEARPLESLAPAPTLVPAFRPRRRWAVALATAIVLMAAIVAAVATSLTGSEDEIIDVPTSVPTESTLPIPTTLPASTTLPATTLPATTVPPVPTTPSQPALGYNVMGSAPFVFVDADGRPGAYFSSEWLYDSPDRLATCADEACLALDETELPLAPGPWLVLDQAGLPLRLQVEVGGEPVPRQTFGEYPASQVEGQAPEFAPASIALAGCVDAGCSDTFRSTVLEVTNPDQVSASNADSVPYPGGGKMSMSPAGNPVIVYGGLLDGEDPVAALAVIFCGDPRCSAGNTSRVIHRSSTTAMILLESVAFGPIGDPVVTFVEAPAERSTDGLLYRTEGGEWRGFIALCTDPVCSAFDKNEVDYEGLPLLAVGVDGNPVIAYGAGDDDQRGIYLQLCHDPVCASSATVQVLDLAPNFAWNLMSPSLAIAPDGAPLITAVEWTGEQGRVHVARCVDATCSSVQATAHFLSDVSPATLLHVWSSAAAFDYDGTPVIAYYQGTLSADENLAFEVDFLRCANDACSTLLP